VVFEAFKGNIRVISICCEVEGEKEEELIPFAIGFSSIR
jgi:hypothetical protein